MIIILVSKVFRVWMTNDRRPALVERCGKGGRSVVWRFGAPRRAMADFLIGQALRLI